MPLTSEERTLIARAIQKDPEAFSQLYVEFYNPVLRRVSSFVNNHYDAEDITSEAFLRAWNAIERFEDRDVSILAWLCTIAERLALKHVKRRRPGVPLDDVDVEAGPEVNPLLLAQRGEDAGAIRSALEELPEVQREVLSRRYLEGMSYDELGLLLGKPVGTVRVIQHRALKALKCNLLSGKIGGRLLEGWGR